MEYMEWNMEWIWNEILVFNQQTKLVRGLTSRFWQ